MTDLHRQRSTIASLHCLFSYDNKLGGAVHAALNICRYLAAQGQPVESVASHVPEDEVEYMDRAYADFPKHRVARSSPCRYYNSAELEPWLGRNLGRFDVVDLHGVWVLTTARAARACRRAGKPYFVHAHGSLDPFDLRKHKLLKRLLGPLFIRPMLGHSVGVICTARLEADLLMTYGANPPRFSVPLPVVPVGATPEARARFRSERGIPDDALVVLFMSRVDYKKGLEFLIPALAEAKKKHTKLWFVMAGSGEPGFTAGIQRLASEAGVVPWMTETGFISGADKLGALSAADLFALPSLNENFGIVLVEALSAGLPLLISDQVYIHGEVTAAGAGLVCGTTAASCQASLLRMLSDPKELRAMGDRGRALSAGPFSVEAATDSLVDIYASALHSTRVRE